MKKRIIVSLVSLFILLTMAITVSAVEPDEADGSFVLTVCTANSMVVRPEKVYYEEGQTVKEALLSSGHDFAGLEERNFIDAIDGVVANYTFFYDGGGYNMNIPASEITAIRIGVTSVPMANQEAMLSLVRFMAEYSAMENHVQNYPNAKEAYNICLNTIRGNGSTASSSEESLAIAIEEYESILAGPKYTVTVTAEQGDRIVSEPVLTLTDEYENVTVATGTTIDVIAGSYTFDISDGGYNRTEGSLFVDNNTSLTVNLPVGEWFGNIYMRSYNWLTGFGNPYRSERDDENHRLTVWVNDTAEGYYGINLVTMIGDVPDQNTTKLRTIYTSVDGRDFSNSTRSWQNSDVTYGNELDSLVARGMEGCSFRLEGQYKDEKGYVQIQSFFIDVHRIPTLDSLTVEAEGTRLSLGNEAYTTTGSLLESTYVMDKTDLAVTTVSDTLDITAIPFSSDYTVSGDGQIAVNENNSIHEISVTAPDGTTTTYYLNISKTGSAVVNLQVPEGVSVEVQTAFGSVISPVGDAYHLIPGETYTYIATKDTYYHTKADFTAAGGETIAVAEPVAEDWLTGCALYSSGVGKEQYLYDSDEPFRPDDHQYRYEISDCNSALYAQATAVQGTAYGQYIGQCDYEAWQSRKREITYQYGDSGATVMLYIIVKGGHHNQLTVSVEKENEGVTYYQDYLFTLDRVLHIYDLETYVNGEAVVYYDNSGTTVDFDRDIFSYTVEANRDAESIILKADYPYGGLLTPLEPYKGGYSAVLYNETDTLTWSDEGRNTPMEVTLPLNPDKDREEFVIRVNHKDEEAVSTEYLLTVKKTDPVQITVNAVPEDLIFTFTNDKNNKRIFDDEGVFLLTPGTTYTYTATRTGYKGVKGQYTAPANDSVFNITLESAPVNSSLVPVEALWPHMRTDNSNNGLIDYPVSINSDDTVLYWAKTIGDGYEDSAVSPPILVNDKLYANCGSYLLMIDPMTGEVLASSEMVGPSSFAITPPTYAEGIIFVGLRGGVIQAFNAATLESLWVYQDSLGGQPNSPILYHDGYVYTGFWNTEVEKADYVCISATDEDPTQPLERKVSTWTYGSPGGFYWSGAYVCDDYLLLGTDDGAAGYGTGIPRLLSFDPKTGVVLSEVNLGVVGDVRSSIVEYCGKYYFTNKGGYFFEASVDASGSIRGVRTINLGGMSTSTPVIYNGRAYVGVCGKGQFAPNAGHCIAVIDIANWEIAYKAETLGYPQGSGVLTTAYEATTGSVYVYLFDNMTPGPLRMLEDKPGQVNPTMVSIEGGYTHTYNLFTPRGEQAQFALCSPIVDEYGTMYFKNDSGYLMAVGSTIDHLEVVQQPDKLTYQAGEVFDGTGLKVTAYLSNGMSRDVTEYLTWSNEPLTADDTDFQLEYPLVMYQNAVADDGQVLTGVDVTPPIATVKLTIDNKIKYGDVNGDNYVNMKDANMILNHYFSEIVLTGNDFKAADVDGNGRITMADFNLIISYYLSEISHFPVEETS
ncbi:MAG: hypothetical protein IKG08_03730 [Eubacterium sp.]|nr:hypothetical protein [Eubacterium sp.]